MNGFLTDLQKAIELVKGAIGDDEKQNYHEAYKQYMNALDYFMVAQKCMYVSTKHLYFALIWTLM
jgi:hypothetical protein